MFSLRSGTKLFLTKAVYSPLTVPPHIGRLPAPECHSLTSLQNDPRFPITPSANGISTTSIVSHVTRHSLELAGRSVKLYRMAFDGHELVSRTELGLNKVAEHARSQNANDIRDPETGTIGNIWIPLPMIRRTLSQWVRRDNETPGDVVSDVSLATCSFMLTN